MEVHVPRRLRQRSLAVALGLAALILAPAAAAAAPAPAAPPLRLDIGRSPYTTFSPHLGPYLLAGDQEIGTALTTFMAGRDPLCLEVQNGTAYIGTADGLSIFDVSNPANPVYLGGTNGWIYDVSVSAGYAYVKVNNDADNNYIAVLDVRDATSPKVVSFINPPPIPHEPSQFPPQLLFNDALLAADGHLYVGEEDFYNNDFSWRALDVYDVADPAHPTLVAQPMIKKNVADLALQGGRLYLGESQYLETVNVSNPAAAAVTSSIYVPVRGLAADGQYLYCGNPVDSGELNVFSLANPSSPVVAGTLQCHRNELYTTDAVAIMHPTAGKSYLLVAWTAPPDSFGDVEVLDVTPPLRFGDQSLLLFKGNVPGISNDRVQGIATEATTAFVAQEYVGVRVSSLPGGSSSGDATAPVTTLSGVDGKWHRSAVVATFTSTDDSSGVADVYVALDDGAFTALGYPTNRGLRITPDNDHSFDGPHSLWYAAIDNAGNLESVKKVTLRFDTLGPVTKALQSVSVGRGARATVKFAANDRWSPKANVTVRIKTLGGRTVKSLALGFRSTNRGLSASFVCTLRRGSYRYFVCAKDLAGNGQRTLGRAAFRVR